MVGEPVDRFGGGGELDRCPAWQTRIAMPVAKRVLPVDERELLSPPPSGSGPSGGLGHTTDNEPRVYRSTLLRARRRPLQPVLSIVGL